jgi:hypothetical protein
LREVFDADRGHDDGLDGEPAVPPTLSGHTFQAGRLRTGRLFWALDSVFDSSDPAVRRARGTSQAGPPTTPTLSTPPAASCRAPVASPTLWLGVSSVPCPRAPESAARTLFHLTRAAKQSIHSLTTP